MMLREKENFAKSETLGSIWLFSIVRACYFRMLLLLLLLLMLLLLLFFPRCFSHMLVVSAVFSPLAPSPWRGASVSSTTGGPVLRKKLFDQNVSERHENGHSLVGSDVNYVHFHDLSCISIMAHGHHGGHMSTFFEVQETNIYHQLAGYW